MKISVVVPCLNEEANLPRLLKTLPKSEYLCEIIVVDGGSSDRTREVAISFDSVSCISSRRGRGAQLNAGAAVATGEVIWFLHADCEVDPRAIQAIFRVFADQRKPIIGGAFRFALSSPAFRYRVIEWGVFVRSFVFACPYGDQGFFVLRSAFTDLGGYPELEQMEDYYFWKKLRSLGPLRMINIPLLTSARKWEQQGLIRTTLGNWKKILFGLDRAEQVRS